MINTALQIVKVDPQQAFLNVIKNRDIVISVVMLVILDPGAMRHVVVAVMVVVVIESAVNVRLDVRHIGMVLNVIRDAALTV